MKTKEADYTFCGGPKIQYDADAPCQCCGLPVENASMGGTAICPACDCGTHRDTGKKWTWQEAFLISRDHITPQQARELCAPIPQSFIDGWRDILEGRVVDMDIP